MGFTSSVYVTGTLSVTCMSASENEIINCTKANFNEGFGLFSKVCKFMRFCEYCT